MAWRKLGMVLLAVILVYTTGESATYDVTRLEITVPRAINSQGDIVGYDAEYQAAARINGEMVILGWGELLDINDQQQVVGDFFVEGFGPAQLWSPQGGPVTLPVDWPGAIADPRALNDAGLIAGIIWPPCSEYDCEGLPYVVTWAPETLAITRLPDLGSSMWPPAEPYGVNDDGVVVGSSWTEEYGIHAVRWLPTGEIEELGVLYGDFSQAFAIAGEEIVGGGLVDEFELRALTWAGVNEIQMLPSQEAWSMSVAHGVNVHGERVGFARRPDLETSVAVHWAADGTPTELSVDNGHLHEALDINAHGQIIGLRYDADWQPEGYLLTPSAQPAPPIASWQAEPVTGVAPLTVTFTDTSSGAIDTWAWIFGNGATSAAQHESVTYPTAGTYTVSLTVTGPGGSDTHMMDIIVRAPPPPAPGPPAAAPGPLPDRREQIAERLQEIFERLRMR